ncbi:MAG: hypothetical protein D6819_09615 [Gammaproteobacteria bacterium]|nr:MAG: hypothetical protein D6819_09615 [Gammaproteobacteria bacterium]
MALKRPVIRTAIPKRRYQIAEFSVVILGDIESDRPYLYILAVVREGEPEPFLYITCEEEGGVPVVRVLAEEGEIEIQRSGRFRDLEAFAEFALQGGMQMLQLQDEIPARLL